MSPRRRDIQGLRGIAVLLVVLYHANLHVPGGFTGVDVFFAISGFVITGVLLRELDARGRVRLGSFYARRIRRLLPALAVMVFVVALAGIVASPRGAQVLGAHTGITAALFSANLYLAQIQTGYFDLGTSFDPFLHTWTLGVEEQFYLVFPTVLFVCWRARRRPRVVALVAVSCLSAASLAVALVLGASDSAAAGRFAFYGSPARAWEFGAGALLALCAHRLPARRALCEVLGVAGVALLAVSAFAIHGTAGFIGPQMLLPVGGSVALLAAGLNAQALAPRALATAPLVWIGDLSYSWYLWHWPVIVFAHALFPGSPVGAGAAALSLIPAWLSYRYVENPVRYSPRFRGRRVLSLVAVCIAVPLAACAALLGSSRLLDRTSAFERWNAVTATYLSSTNGCESTTPLGQRTGARWSACTFTVPNPRGRIVLVGDSNAAQLTEPVVRAGNRAGYDVTVAPRTGCPFIQLRGVFAGQVENECHHFDTATLAALTRDPPAIVVLANRDDLNIAKPEQGYYRPDGTVTHDAREKAQLLSRDLRATLTRLDRAGTAVLVVRPVPLMPLAPAGCAVVRVLLDSCASSVTRAAANRALAPATEAETQAARGLPRVRIVDFVPVLCGPARCSTARGKTIVYYDRDHLNPDGARLLTGPLERLFRSE